MKFRHKLLLSVCAGFLAMLLYSGPMWWGVLFSPITQSLTTASSEMDADGGVRWESDGAVLRFKSLDMLFSFLHLSYAVKARPEFRAGLCRYTSNLLFRTPESAGDRGLPRGPQR